MFNRFLLVLLLLASNTSARPASKPYPFEGAWAETSRNEDCIRAGDEENVFEFDDDFFKTPLHIYRLIDISFNLGEYTARYFMVDEDRGGLLDMNRTVSIRVSGDRKSLSMTFTEKETGERHEIKMTNCSVFGAGKPF